LAITCGCSTARSQNSRAPRRRRRNGGYPDTTSSCAARRTNPVPAPATNSESSA
jgi:hypothetical protein